MSVESLTDALHRTLLDGNDGRCWLLLDSSVRPLETDCDLAHALRTAGRTTERVSLVDGRLNEAEMPELVPLNIARSNDSAVLTASVQEALLEVNSNALQHGMGRRIGGWLTAHASTTQLARHIGRQMIQRRGHRTVLLRWVDPAALWAFWPSLLDVQRAALLGPIEAYRMLDPRGSLVTLTGPSAEPDRSQSALDLTASQWDDADAVGALNSALRRWGVDRTESEMLLAARTIGMAAMRRARVRGFGRERDLAAFAFHAIDQAAMFDLHPLVCQRFDAAEPDAYVDAVLNDLSPDDWQRIRLEVAT